MLSKKDPVFLILLAILIKRKHLAGSSIFWQKRQKLFYPRAQTLTKGKKYDFGIIYLSIPERGTPLKIAFVDDEQKCLDEMAEICRSFGAENHCKMETASFTSGEAFLKAMENDSFSMVFMDVYMDGMDGIATALKMRKLDSLW